MTYAIIRIMYMPLYTSTLHLDWQMIQQYSCIVNHNVNLCEESSDACALQETIIITGRPLWH